MARETRSRHAWQPGTDISAARNAHYTNTADQMRQALSSAANFLEGDLRVGPDGRLVMAHEASEEGTGLTFKQWLSIARDSGRGVKVDVKEIAALPGLLKQLERSGIEHERLIINVAAWGNPGERADLLTFQQIRQRFPTAWINIGASSYREITDGILDALTGTAQAIGGNVMFPMQWDLVNERIVRRLAPHGRIAVWTSKVTEPVDAAREAARLATLGINGMIDLGERTGVELIVQPLLRGLRGLIGQDSLIRIGRWFRERGIA